MNTIVYMRGKVWESMGIGMGEYEERDRGRKIEMYAS